MRVGLRFTLMLALGLLIGVFPMRAQQGSSPTGRNGAIVGYQGNVESLASGAKGQYLLLDLGSIPTAAQRASWLKRGVEVKDWVGGTTYWCYVKGKALPKVRGGETLQAAGVQRALGARPVRQVWQSKVEAAILDGQIPEWAAAGGKRFRMDLCYHQGKSAAEVEAFIQRLGGRLEWHDADFQVLCLEGDRALAEALARQVWVRSVVYVRPPQELENQNGAGLNRARVLQSARLDGGFDLRGKGVTVGFWDGRIDETHKDYADRMVVAKVDGAVSEHAVHVAGTIGGAGTLDVQARGMAPEARLVAYTFNPYDRPSIRKEAVEKYQAIVQSNSFGRKVQPTECGTFGYNVYNESTDGAADRFILEQEETLVVYSAGNYQDACKGGYTTSTRNGKNIMTVGALDAREQMTSFSSWGPLHDGRLVPLVSTFGQDVYSCMPGNRYQHMDGTSMACPNVSGLSALLYQGYREANGGENPKSILVKNALMNTAQDRGNIGPDYQYGYGVVRGNEAMELLLDKTRYTLEEITHDELKEWTVELPAGLPEVRFMITWHDQGQAALVDDLDMAVLAPNGMPYLPYRLDPSNPSAPAVRGEEHINNHEQVVVSNPVAGKYTVRVKGFRVPSAKVRYSITCYYPQGGVRLVSPAQGDRVNAGQNGWVRWDAHGMRGEATLYLSLDDGATYSVLQRVPDLSAGMQLVSFPGEVNVPKARLRMVYGDRVIDGVGTFILCDPLPSLVLTKELCTQNCRFSWSEIKGVKGYEVWLMENDLRTPKSLVHTTTSAEDTSYVWTFDADAITNYYAVRTVYSDGSFGYFSRAVQPIVAYGVTIASSADLPYAVDFSGPKAKHAVSEQGEYCRVLDEAIGEFPFLVVVAYADGQSRWETSLPGEEFEKNPKFIGRSAFCLDLTGYQDQGSSISGRFFLIMQESRLTRARLVVLKDDGTVERVLKTVDGREILEPDPLAKIIVPEYDFTPMVGQRVRVAVEGLAQGGNAQNPAVKLDKVLIGTFTLFEVKEKDLRVKSVILPPKAATLSSAEKVKVVVENVGVETMQGASLEVKLNGNSVHTETLDALDKGALKTITLSLDMSAADALYEVEAILTHPDDMVAGNNSRKALTMALGDWQLLQDLPRTTPASVQLAAGAAMKVADNGSRFFNYEKPKSGDARKTALTIVPPAGKHLKLEFQKLELAEGDKLELLNGPNSYSSIFYLFEGRLDGPKTVIGQLPSKYSSINKGQVTLVLHSNSEASASGFEVLVSEAAATDEPSTVNVVSASKMVAQMDADGKVSAGIEYEVIADAVGELSAYYFDQQGDMVEEKISDPALLTKGTHTYQFQENRIHFTKYPTVFKLQGGLLCKEDPIQDDNSQTGSYSGLELTYDKYPATKINSQSIDNKSLIKSVNGITITTSDLFSRKLIYATEQPIVMQKGAASNALSVEVEHPNSDPCSISYYLDANGDFTFNGEQSPVVNITAPLANPYLLPVDVSNLAVGMYRVRVVLQRGSKSIDLNELDYGFRNGAGCVVDVTIDVQDGSGPVSAGADLEVVDLKHTTPLNDQCKLTVTFANRGGSKISQAGYSVIVNGKEYPFPGTLDIEAGQSVEVECPQAFDFSLNGTYEVSVVGHLQDDVDPLNNAKTISLVQSGHIVPGESYVMDFKSPTSVVAFELTDAPSSTFTYEGWYYFRSYGNTTTHQGFGNLVNREDFFVYTEADIPKPVFKPKALVIAVGGGKMFSKDWEVPLNEWVHLAVTFASGQLSAYANGEPITLALHGSTPLGTPAGKAHFLGNNTAGTRAFDGKMDGVRIWNVARSAQEIKDAMQTRCQGQAGLVAEFMFDEGVGSPATLYTVDKQAQLKGMESLDQINGPWQPEPLPEYASLKVDNQLHPEWIEKGSTLQNEVPKGTDLSKIALTATYTMVNTEAKHDGAPVPAEIDFTSPYSVVLSAPWIGGVRENTFELKLVEELGSEALLLTLELGAPVKSGAISPKTGESIRVIPADKSGSFDAVPVTFTLSPGATLHCGGVELKSGTSTINLGQTQKLTVVSENGLVTTDYFLTLDKDYYPVTFTVTSKDAGTPLPEALVTVGSQSGKTNADGVVVLNLPAGQHDYTVTLRPDYEDATGSVEVKKGAVSQKVEMVRSAAPAVTYPVTFTVTSKDGGAPLAEALVTVGSQSGKTNADGVVVLNLPAGQHDYTVTLRPDYEDATGSVKVEDRAVSQKVEMVKKSSVAPSPNPQPKPEPKPEAKPTPVDAEAIGISVYPNPVSTRLFVTATQPISMVEIFSVHGMLVHREVVSGSSAQVEMSDVPCGIYILRVHSAGTVYQQRVLRK